MCRRLQSRSEDRLRVRGPFQDLGGQDNITTAQEVLVDRAISRLGLVLLLEKFGREHGVFTKDGGVHDVFVKLYLPSLTGLRNELALLGIDRRKVQSEPQLADYIVSMSNAKGNAQPKPQDGQDEGGEKRIPAADEEESKIA